MERKSGVRKNNINFEEKYFNGKYSAGKRQKFQI